jgi:beta-glucosidase
MRSRFAAALAALVIVGALVSGGGVARASGCSAWMNQQSSSARAHALLNAMSLQDKVNLVTGDTGQTDPSYPNYGAAGVIFGNSALCIPPLVLNDAGAGIGDTQVLTTAFPDGVTQASTWDIPLLRQYGDVLGREAFVKGVNILLGPGIDILRDPLNGRGWEYYGEDPYLTGQAGAAIAQGIQENPVVATIKHYAADDQEGTSDNNFGTISNDVGPRTMQEIELPAFGFSRVAIAPGHSSTVMIALAQRAFEYWRVREARWALAPGCYAILVGDSSASLPLRRAIPFVGHRARCRRGDATRA